MRNNKGFAALIAVCLVALAIGSIVFVGYATKVGFDNSAPEKLPISSRTDNLGAGGTIETIDQFTSTTSPSLSITQRTYGKAIRLTGLENESCLGTDANGIVGAGTCSGGSGSSFAWPFTAHTGYVSTSTVLGLNGFFSTASSTISGAFRLPALSQGFAYLGSGGLLNTTASSSINLSWFNNDAGFITSSTQSPFEIATTSSIAVPGLAYFTKTSGRTTLGSVATSTLTASSPLTGSFTQVGSGGSIGCQTASGSQAGCLSSTDWTTFNNKLGSYDAFTHPSTGVSATTSGLLVTASSTIGSGSSAGGLTVSGNATSTGIFRGGDGAEAAPTYSFSSNQGTGMFRVSSGILGFSINGTGHAALNSTNFYPYTNDATALGLAGTAWSDLFLASGGVIGWGNGDLSLTHSTGKLTMSANDNFTATYSSTTDYASFQNSSTTAASIGTLTLPNISGTQCLHSVSGVVSGTGSDCGSGGGTNYLTNSGSNTYLNTGTNLQAPVLMATSTTATSSITNALQIGTTAGDNALKITAGRNYLASQSVGGMVNFSCTSNAGPCFNTFSNFGSGATAALVKMMNTNEAYDQTILTLQSASLSRTTLDITGSSTAQGTVKITHYGSGADANASGISLDLYSTSTTPSAVQGIFITSTKGGTTGKPLQIKNNMAAFGGTDAQVNIFDLTGDGKVGLSSSTPWAKLSINPVAQDGSAPWFAIGSTTGGNKFVIDNTGTTTSSNGFNITGGCYALNGTCLSGGTIIGGSGNVATSSQETITYVPFWTSTNGTPATLGSDNDFTFSTSTRTLTVGTGLNDGSVISNLLFAKTISSVASTIAPLTINTTHGSSGNGGDITISASDGLAGGDTGGNLSLSAGSAGSGAQGGNVSITAGNSGTGNNGGSITQTLGATGSGGNGGDYTLIGANGSIRKSNFLASGFNSFQVGTSTSDDTLNSTFFTLWNGAAKAHILDVITNASSTVLSVSNTGFGTTTLSGLNISGSATSTSNVGFNITSGCYAVNGTCVSGGGGGSSFGQSWEINAGGYLAPTTTITTLHPQGFVSQASSTVIGNFAAALGTNGIAQLNDGSSASAIWGINGGIIGTGGNSILTGTGNSNLTFNVGGTRNTMTAGTEAMRIGRNFKIAMGTSTPSLGLLTIASSTDQQLLLSSGAGIAQWAFRNAGGNLYISTTTVDGTATSSIPALQISNSGGPSLQISTTTAGCAQFSATGELYSVGSNCGSGGGGGSDPFTHYNGVNSATTTSMAIGTTTANNYQLAIASSTAPQLSLSAGAGIAQWVQRNAGGNLYFATTTVAGTATTTTASLSLLNTGEVVVRNLFQIFNTTGTKIMDVVSNTITLLGTWDFSGATVKVHTYPAFSYATSTAWTGTTTIPLGPAYTAESWSGVQCFTDTGTVNVSFNDGTNRMNMLNASTTVGLVTLSTNNTFTLGEKRYVDIGTPASSPTKISCSVDKIVNN